MITENQIAALRVDAEQREHLDRVKRRISSTVLDFCASRVGECFHMGQLVAYMSGPGIAPDSPSRILRSLRQSRAIGYTVINRGQSLYRVDWVKAA